MDNLLPVPRIPVGEFVENVTEWMTINLSGFFDAFKNGGDTIMGGISNLLLMIPPFLFIILLAVLAYFASKRRFGLPVFVLIGFGYILNQGLWTELIDTITLVLVSALISVVIGIPLGILTAKSKIAHTIVEPILDLMQTMPAFVYLIPAVAFFGIGMVPGMVASVIFALPPTVRFTELGLNEIPEDLIEAADAFGSTSSQKLFKVELPLATATMMAGVNQTVMLALSMVVTGSMIGAPGLGDNVLTALQQSQVGNGFTAGLGIVILAITIDRMTKTFAAKRN